MKIIRVILTIFIFILFMQALITKDFSNSALLSLIFGLCIGIMAIEQFKEKGRNSIGMAYLPMSIIIIVGSLFSL